MSLPMQLNVATNPVAQHSTNAASLTNAAPDQRKNVGERPKSTSERATKRAKKEHRPNYTKPSAMVHIVVGEGDKQHTFSVFKDILTNHSPFFAQAFAPINPGRVQRITLEEIASETFGLINHWLYEREIYTDPQTDPDFHQLIDLWCVAQRFQMPALQNDAMRMLKPLVAALPSAGKRGFATTVYGMESTARTPLRELAVFEICWGTSAMRIQELGVLEPPDELLYDCIRHLMVFCEGLPDGVYPTEREPDAFFVKECGEDVKGED